MKADMAWLRVTAGILTLCVASGAAHAIPTLGPQYPPIGGVSFGTSGALSAGDLGGINLHFTGFNPATFTELYWGPNGITEADVGGGLDGTLQPFVFSRIVGTQAYWKGTSSWTNPTSGTYYPSVRMELAITISGLGANPWATANLVGGTVSSTLGASNAVVANPLGNNFTANLQFLGDPTGMGWQPLNTIQQASAGLTRTSFYGAFYGTPVPEPATLALLGLGLVGMGVVRRRKSR